MKYSTKKTTTYVIFCVILAVLIAVNAVVACFFDVLDALVEGTFSTASAEEIADTLNDGARLAETIEGEGIVLVKNTDNALPLGKSINRINVFGWSSTQWVYGGSGSGQCGTKNVDFLQALSDYGVEYNTQLTDMYKRFLDNRPYADKGALHSYNYEFSRIYEPSIDDGDYYSSQLLAEAKSFSDTAIVVLGRVSGESNDCPKSQYKQVKSNGKIIVDDTRTYLEISTEEQALLEYVGQNFDKVIVLVNSTNTLELGFVDSGDIDACLIVGGTGDSSATAVVKALYGDINPSGKTVDTYAYDMTTAASYANSAEEGEGAYTNSKGLYPYGVKNANVGDNKAKYEAVYYVDYVEDIYIGYKWYETADIEGYWLNKGGYDNVVQYPFGYGLSYTTFTQEIVGSTPTASSELSANDIIKVSVKVTNNGNVAGKQVVQLYYTAPYYKGGIEKSAVVLGAFAKTKTLQAGESQVLELSLRVYDMASYDCYDRNGNGFDGYELEYGQYTLSLRTDSHTVVDSVVYNVGGDGIRFDKDPDTGADVTNRFTGSNAEDGVAIDGTDSNANIVYLTRADFAGTFPTKKASDRAMADNVIAKNLYEVGNQTSATDKPTYGKNNGIVVYKDGKITETGLRLGRDYNDSMWEDLLDQLTEKETEQLIYHLYLSPNVAISSIGKYKPFEADGPTQIGSFNTARHGTGFPMPTVIAQTWNVDLAEAFGSQVALEAANLGFDGWYAPGINMHRSPFGGRNYEYYSEDVTLSAEFCVRAVNASLDRGVYVYIKHFVNYDQDANRDSLYTWLTEQNLRETYLKPFEKAVKAGATGLMSSYNRLGAVWTGGSRALNTSVLRNEWQFNGALLTDFCDHSEYVNADQFLLAGGDQVLYSFGSSVSLKGNLQSAEYTTAMRRAAKDSVYIWLNALTHNHDKAAEGKIELRNPRDFSKGWLRPVLIVIDVCAFAVMCVWLYFIVRKHNDISTTTTVGEPPNGK